MVEDMVDHLLDRQDYIQKNVDENQKRYLD